MRLFRHRGGLAGSVLHLSTLAFQDFEPGQAQELLKTLAGLEVVVGLDPRADYELLSLGEANRRYLDLTPPFKSRKLNQADRRVHFDDPAQGIRMTVSTSQPLGDPHKLAAYWELGQWGAFWRRLQSDLKSLYQYYRYGVEHGYILLRWGFLQETVSVNWNLGQEPTVYEMVHQALDAEASLELVCGCTPGFENRFSRARPFRPLGLGFGWVEGGYEDTGLTERVALPDITACRPALADRLAAALRGS